MLLKIGSTVDTYKAVMSLVHQRAVTLMQVVQVQMDRVLHLYYE